MPIFVYKCESCGNVEEKIQKLSDVVKFAFCSKCKGVLLREVTNCNFRFKE